MSENEETADDVGAELWQLRQAEDMLEELARRGAVEITTDDDGVKRYRMLPDWRERLGLNG
jgi:hypothetical protein